VNGESHILEQPSVFTEASRDCRSVERYQTRFETSEVSDRRVGVAQEDFWIVTDQCEIQEREETNRESSLPDRQHDSSNLLNS
jgi:hypothetical protein